MKVIRGGDVRKGPVKVSIISGHVPSELPVNGKDVDGMTEEQTFATGSILYITDPAADPKWYMADENGIFIGQPFVSDGILDDIGLRLDGINGIVI